VPVRVVTRRPDGGAVEPYDCCVGFHRGLSFTSGLAGLLAVMVFAPTAHARTAVSEIRGTILRVESAAVDDDPGACALMSRGVQRELLQSGRPLGHRSKAGCRQAVRRLHLTFASADELGSARQILREQLATLATSPVLFAFGRQRASVTVIAIEHESEPGTETETETDGYELQSTLTFGVVAVGRGWEVASLDEQQQTLNSYGGATPRRTNGPAAREANPQTREYQADTRRAQQPDRYPPSQPHTLNSQAQMRKISRTPLTRRSPYHRALYDAQTAYADASLTEL
jgi:hypothetical protein